jgi:2-polyprenyl-3-methyl-5-hydroxy-6-metoxy-1,4-benzoquinol methylase
VTRSRLASRWDAEYRRGRYAGEPPLAFLDTIKATLRDRGLSGVGTGLYVGCGNGRNYLPLVDAGFTAYGLDVSAEGLRALAAQRPTITPYLICQDFRRFQSAQAFGYVIALQVFQHGRTADVKAYFEKVAALLQRGGLFFLRVNSVSTQVSHAHSVLERDPSGGMTIRYREGPKRGLAVHFYAREELGTLTVQHFKPAGELREQIIARTPPRTGTWAQWEMTWERR